jgi:hypothetical protein
MSEDFWVQGFGLAASVVVALSLTMRNIKWLRLLSLIGSLAFAVYGCIIVSYSVIFLNVFSVGINLYYLVKMVRQPEDIFEVVFADPRSDDYVKRFFRFYNKDIGRFFPSFVYKPDSASLEGAESCFILRENLAVALIIFRRENDASITLLFDYSIPAYRDFKNAKYFFSAILPKIAEPGTLIYARAEVPAHKSYLKRMDFDEIGKNGKTIFFRKMV